MATIKPTVGRVVWFYNENGQGPLAAQIAWVHSDGMVNIGYLDANGLACAATSVSLIQEGDERPTGYYCEWMPYQKGQAAKTEAAEKTALELGAEVRRSGQVGAGMSGA